MYLCLGGHTTDLQRRGKSDRSCHGPRPVGLPKCEIPTIRGRLMLIHGRADTQSVVRAETVTGVTFALRGNRHSYDEKWENNVN